MNVSRPRLLLVGLVPPEAGGCISCGVATHVFELGRQAAARGYETSILAPLRSNRVSGAESIRLLNASRPRTSRLLSGGWGAIRRGGHVPVLPALNWRNRISVLSWTERIREAMEETRAEIVHIHPLLHPGGPGLGDLPQGIPFIFTDHGFWQDLRDDDDMKKIRETARLATAVVAVSRHCLDQQDRLGLAFGGSREVIPNAITPAPDEVGRGQGAEGRPRVLFVAGVDSITRKGLDILIRAFAENPELKSGAELAVITEAESASWAAAAMAAEGIAGAVHPPCSRQELAAVYRAADVLALPSRSEAFGLVFLEALAVGTPVVGFAPTILELRERLGEDVGLPFDAGLETPADLAAKLLAVLRRPKERDGLATRTKAAFSWDVIFPALDRLYLRLWRRERA